MKSEFAKSTLVFIPLAAALSLINMKIEHELIPAVLYGILGGICVYFVPWFFRVLKKS